LSHTVHEVETDLGTLPTTQESGILFNTREIEIRWATGIGQRLFIASKKVGEEVLVVGINRVRVHTT
jgi:hypothetical protein